LRIHVQSAAARAIDFCNLKSGIDTASGDIKNVTGCGFAANVQAPSNVVLKMAIAAIKNHAVAEMRFNTRSCL